MSIYKLPTSLTIGEVEYSIRYGWETAVEILCEMNRPEMETKLKVAGMLKRLFPDWSKIPYSDIQEAIEKACDYLNCGQKTDKRTRPKLIDWEQDAEIIIPAVNKAAGREVRQETNIHWWTFYGWFMSIEGGVFSTVLRIRSQLAKGKPLQQWEREFYADNRHLIDIRTENTETIRQEKDNILRWL